MLSSDRKLSTARAIGGTCPPEEGGTTLPSSEGPTSHRLVGVAPTDGRGFQIPAASTRNEKRVRSPGPASHFWSMVEFETRLLRGVRGSVAPPGSNGEVSGLAPPRRSAVPSSNPIQGDPP